MLKIANKAGKEHLLKSDFVKGIKLAAIYQHKGSLSNWEELIGTQDVPIIEIKAPE